jgi:cytochrome c oxidase subunit 2
VDKPLVVPVDTVIEILLTSTDVLHSFAVPSFGIKRDTVPGKLNQTWIKVKKEGTYYGQCSELCGIDHGFMPIMVKAVSKEAFKEWIASQKPQEATTVTVKEVKKTAH